MMKILAGLLFAALSITAGSDNPYTNNWLISNFPGEINDGWGGAYTLEPPEFPIINGLMVIELWTEFTVGVENLSECPRNVTLGYDPDGDGSWLGPNVSTYWDRNQNGIYEEGLDQLLLYISHDGENMGSTTLESFDGRVDMGGRSGTVSRDRFDHTIHLIKLPQELILQLHQGNPQTIFFGSSVHTNVWSQGDCYTGMEDAVRCEFDIFAVASYNT